MLKNFLYKRCIMANKYYICTDDNTIGTEADYTGRQLDP